jgi:hypothetical protein
LGGDSQVPLNVHGDVVAEAQWLTPEGTRALTDPMDGIGLSMSSMPPGSTADGDRCGVHAAYILSAARDLDVDHAPVGGSQTAIRRRAQPLRHR